MKKHLLLIFPLFLSAFAYSQINFGVKAGMNIGNKESLRQTITDIKESNGKNILGWHAGVFGQVNFAGWFVQPEIYYSSIKTEFNSSESNFHSRVSNLDIPVLLGKRFLGIAKVYGGPVFSTSLEEKISLKDIKKTNSDDFSLAGQVGTGIEISSFLIDVRYEFGFNKRETKFINNATNNQFLIEKRQNSVLLSLGYKF